MPLEFDIKWLDEIERDTINWAEYFGDFLAQESDSSKPLTTTQLRRFFGEIKRIQTSRDFEKEKDSVLMLKPKLAYAAARDEGKTKFTKFYEIIALGLDAIKLSNPSKAAIQFQNFVKIYEAIVAYHKVGEVKRKSQKQKQKQKIKS